MAFEDNRSPEDGGNYITGPTKLGKAGLNEIKGQKNILEYLENEVKIKVSEDKRQKIKKIEKEAANFRNLLGYLN
jgi:hypothetical protein